MSSHTGDAALPALEGTSGQIELAEEIRDRVGKDFNRVANALRSVACRQTARNRKDTEAMLAILNEKRVEIMSIEKAGSFIRDWREPGDRVRELLLGDARYIAIRNNQASYRRQTNDPARLKS